MVVSDSLSVIAPGYAIGAPMVIVIIYYVYGCEVRGVSLGAVRLLTEAVE